MPLCPDRLSWVVGEEMSRSVVDVFAAGRQCKMGRFYLIAGWQSLMAAAGGVAALLVCWQKLLKNIAYFKLDPSLLVTRAGGDGLARAGGPRLWLVDTGTAEDRTPCKQQ